MKGGYKIWLILGALTISLLFLISLRYPDYFYSPGELIKEHSDIGCTQCHTPFGGTPSRLCSTADCHPSGNIGKGATVRDLHIKAASKRCTLCHTEHAGKGANITKAFKHSTLKASADCAECHITEGKKAHSPPIYKRDCKLCHSTKDWKDVSFNHRSGLARGATCVECHDTPADVLHRGVSEDCSGCHGTRAWKPSTFDHSRYFALDRTHRVSCKTCHDSGSYRRYTCLNCHEHSSPGIINEHLEEGIRHFGDCLRCHRVYLNGGSYGTGRADEGIGGEEYEEENEEDEYRRYHRYNPHKGGYYHYEEFEYEDDD